MSKEKARKRAEQRKKAKQKQEQKRLERVASEKAAFADRSANNIERNKDEFLFRKAKQAKKNRIFEFSSKLNASVFDQVRAAIGDDHVLAKDFILEEIEAAYISGNPTAIKAAEESGITREECRNALDREKVSVERGPQTIMLEAAMVIMETDGVTAATKARLEVIDAVMQRYEIGRYSRAAILSERFSAASIVFSEYAEFLRGGKGYNVTSLCKTVLDIAENMEEISDELGRHLIVAKIVAMIGKNVHVQIMPPEILSTVMTDLGLTVLCAEEYFVKALRTLHNDGLDKDDFVSAVDLCRRVGPFGSGVINFAAPLHNLMSLLFEELPDSEDKERYLELMGDLSLVEGSVRGSVMGLAGEYEAWCYEVVGSNG